MLSLREGRWLRAGGREIDLERPFDLQLTRSEASEDGGPTLLNVEVVDSDSSSVPVRIGFSVPVAPESAEDAEYTALPRWHGAELIPGSSGVELWTALKYYAVVHGQVLPAFDLELR